MTISNNELSRMHCVACGETFGDHSKREIIRCIFRIQGTAVHQKVKEDV
tara:strand:- start:165 stop:311 length:147 start_codon:yes stop_codon:yes gene_type:complete